MPAEPLAWGHPASVPPEGEAQLIPLLPFTGHQPTIIECPLWCHMPSTGQGGAPAPAGPWVAAPGLAVEQALLLYLHISICLQISIYLHIGRCSGRCSCGAAARLLLLWRCS